MSPPQPIRLLGLTKLIIIKSWFFPPPPWKCLRAARIDELADSNEPAIISQAQPKHSTRSIHDECTDLLAMCTIMSIVEWKIGTIARTLTQLLLLSMIRALINDLCTIRIFVGSGYKLSKYTAVKCHYESCVLPSKKYDLSTSVFTKIHFHMCYLALLLNGWCIF